MEADILNYSPTVIFRGTPCRFDNDFQADLFNLFFGKLIKYNTFTYFTFSYFLNL